MSSASDPSPDSPAPAPEERTVTVAPPPPPPVTPPRASDETGTLLPASQAPADRVPETIQAPAPPGYELISEIGRGGMGVVYKARQRGLNRLVALKVVLAGGHASVAQRMRFLAEAEAVAALNHPGIIGVYEFGTLDGQPYMALEYCPGGTLADRLRGTPMRPRDAAELTERVARAVATAHDRGVVHRDLKPANILLSADGTPKITDFGLAKMVDQLGSLTVTGAVMGTPSYMAPEQARGDAKTVGPPADVYALGAVLYECLTGRPPFRGANPADTIVQSLEREPVAVRALNPAVPADLETVCLKCLEKEPSRRYPHAAAFADDLARFLAGRPVVARPVGPLGRARRWVGRNQVVTGLLVAIVLAVAGGTAATYVKYLDEAKQHAVADREREKAQAETVAKEKALQQLRQTLAALEELTEEQKKTLDRLRVEKAATEDALLRGLLRPLRNQANSFMTLEEARVLFEAAALPEERLRFRFVERGLGTVEDAEKLAAWPHEVVAAAAGLDRAAAVRLRDVVGRILVAPATKPDVRVACAALAGALPPDDPEFNLAAARALADQLVAEDDPTALREPAESLRVLAPRLRPADAAQVARLLNARLARESHVDAAAGLGVAVSELAKRLDPADAAVLARPLLDRIEESGEAPLAALTDAAAALCQRAGPERLEALVSLLARSLTARVPTDKDGAGLNGSAVTLSQCSDLLPPGRGAAQFGPALRALAARMGVEKDGNILYQLSSAVSWVGTRASPDDAAAAATLLADRVRVEKDGSTLSTLGSALNVLASNVPDDALSGLARALAARMATETDYYALGTLAFSLGLLADRMPPDQAAALVRPLALAAAARSLVEKDAATASYTGSLLSNLARFLTPSDAAAVVMSLTERMATEKETTFLSYFSGPLGNAAARLDPRDAAPFARILAARLTAEKDAFTAQYFASPFADLLGRLPPDEAQAVARPVVRAYAERVAAEKESPTANNLSMVLLNVAPHSPKSDAAAAARRLASRMLSDRDWSDSIQGQVQPFLALAERVGGDEGAAMVAAVARGVRDRLAVEKVPGPLNQLQGAFSNLASRLAPAESAAHARLFASRLANDRENGVHSHLANAVTAVAGQLEPADAAAITRTLTPRFGEKDYGILQPVATVVTAVAPRLAPEDAAPVAKELVRRMVATKEPTNASVLASTFGALVPQLADADLLALLKANLPYPPIRTPILGEFGRRSGRAHHTPAIAVAGAAGVVATPSPGFDAAWEFAEWAEKARPDWDLRGPRRG